MLQALLGFLANSLCNLKVVVLQVGGVANAGNGLHTEFG